MNRRDFCLYTSALLVGDRTCWAAPAVDVAPPWFDPSYATLPTPAEQSKRLAANAAEAQSQPRMVASVPVTGLPLDLKDFDGRIVREMTQGGLVGVTLAIAIEGQLIVARGFGYLSSHDKSLASPTSPGYIGSITKPLCAMAALTLARDRKLDLDARVLDVMPLDPLLKPNESRQPEIDMVTIRMLMNHTSGLFNNVERLLDRKYYARLAATGALRLVHGDVSQYDLVRRGMAIPFVSKPGAEAHYSGQGLQVLGRVVEKVSGQRLDKFISEKMLEPCGVHGHATLSYLSPETRRALDAGKGAVTGSMIPSPFDGRAGKCVSWRYEELRDELPGNHWGLADACGASMMSALELVRFVSGFRQVIGPELFRESMTIPSVHNDTFHGLGWGTGKTNGAYQFGHGGAIQGARAFCESTWDGVQYGILGAGDQDAAFDRIKSLVVDLGRELRGQLRGQWRRSKGWNLYGFDPMR